MSDCPHRTISGKPCCQFEARLDKSAATMPAGRIKRCSEYMIENLTEMHRSITYVRDVCIKCGRTIERQK